MKKLPSGLKWSLWMVLCIVSFVFVWTMAFAEMRVTTHDGRTLRVPVDAKDVRTIEFENRDFGGGQRYLGCYKDQGDPSGTSGRDLAGFVFNDARMTTDKCTSACRDKGFQFAATQYSSWCFCGNSYGRFGRASNCNMKCSGNANQTCGGSWANSVYSLD